MVSLWFRILSVRGRCPGLGERAEAYAYKFVEEDKLNNGWLWLTAEKEYWLQNMKRGHYRVLETYGFARKDTLSHWGLSAPPVKARDERLPAFIEFQKFCTMIETSCAVSSQYEGQCVTSTFIAIITFKK